MAVYPEAWADHGMNLEELRLLDVRLNVAWRRAGYWVPPRFDRSQVLPWSFERIPGHYPPGDPHGSLWGPEVGVFIRREALCLAPGFCRWRWLFCDRRARLVVVETVRRTLHPLGIDGVVWIRDEADVDSIDRDSFTVDDIRAEFREKLGSPQPSILDTDPGLAAVAERGQVEVWFDEPVTSVPVIAAAELDEAILESQREIEELSGRTPTGEVSLAPRELLLKRLVDLAVAPDSELGALGRVEERACEGTEPVDLVLSVSRAPDGAFRVEGEVVGCSEKAAQLGQRRAFLRLADGQIVPAC